LERRWDRRARGDRIVKIDNTELWSGLFGLGLSIFVTYQGYILGMGSISDPGSGYVMIYCGLLMFVFTFIILYGALTTGGRTFKSLWEGTLWTKPVWVILSLVVFTFAFEPLGFLISTTILLIVLLRVIDPVKWSLAIPIALLTPFICWYVLQKMLLIQLPSGMFNIG
jgi:putative tricarboxylic transport membrane protein